MILVVSLNPALDITHHVAGVDWSGVNRPREVSTAPGGKGLNVARTLHALGADVRVVGLAGGIVGEAVAAALAAAGVTGAFAPIAGQTRRTFAVVDTSSHDTALFNEPGPVRPADPGRSAGPGRRGGAGAWPGPGPAAEPDQVRDPGATPGGHSTFPGASPRTPWPGTPRWPQGP